MTFTVLDRAPATGPAARLGSNSRYLTSGLLPSFLSTTGLVPVLLQKNRLDCGVLGRCRGVPVPAREAGHNPHLMGRGSSDI